MMVMHDEEDINDVWKKIWQLKVQERVKSFVWMFGHDRLLTNFQKSMKGMGE